MAPKWSDTVPIGKYKGREYQWIAVADPYYFAWLMTKCDNIKVRRWRYNMEEKLEPEESDESYNSC